jgi:hypothetical protein
MYARQDEDLPCGGSERMTLAGLQDFGFHQARTAGRGAGRGPQAGAQPRADPAAIFTKNKKGVVG